MMLNGLQQGIHSFRSFSPLFRAITVRHSLNEKPDRSARMRVVVRLGFGVTEPHQTAAISARDGKAAHAP
jgi:hypothetical protein